MKQIFEITGYYVDYYSNGKFIGNIAIDQRDREKTGYEGRIEYVLETDLKVGKKTLKKGTLVKTQLNPIMGKMIQYAK